MSAYLIFHCESPDLPPQRSVRCHISSSMMSRVSRTSGETSTDALHGSRSMYERAIFSIFVFGSVGRHRLAFSSASAASSSASVRVPSCNLPAKRVRDRLRSPSGISESSRAVCTERLGEFSPFGLLALGGSLRSSMSHSGASGRDVVPSCPLTHEYSPLSVRLGGTKTYPLTLTSRPLPSFLPVLSFLTSTFGGSLR